MNDETAPFIREYIKARGGLSVLSEDEKTALAEMAKPRGKGRQKPILAITTAPVPSTGGRESVTPS